MGQQTLLEGPMANFSKHCAVHPLALTAVASLGHPLEDHQNKTTSVRTWCSTSLTCMTAYLPTVETKRWLGPQLVKQNKLYRVYTIYTIVWNKYSSLSTQSVPSHNKSLRQHLETKKCGFNFNIHRISINVFHMQI